MNSETQTLIVAGIVLLVVALPLFGYLIRYRASINLTSRATHRREKARVSRSINQIRAKQERGDTEAAKGEARQSD